MQDDWHADIQDRVNRLERDTGSVGKFITLVTSFWVAGIVSRWSVPYVGNLMSGVIFLPAAIIFIALMNWYLFPKKS